MECSVNESARGKVRIGEATEMRKELRDSIISGVVSAILGTIILYIVRREFAWAYLITFPIFWALAHLLGVGLHKRREAKNEEEDQRRE